MARITSILRDNVQTTMIEITSKSIRAQGSVLIHAENHALNLITRRNLYQELVLITSNHTRTNLTHQKKNYHYDK